MSDKQEQFVNSRQTQKTVIPPIIQPTSTKGGAGPMKQISGPCT